jgi:hypothetical protein
MAFASPVAVSRNPLIPAVESAFTLAAILAGVKNARGPHSVEIGFQVGLPRAFAKAALIDIVQEVGFDLQGRPSPRPALRFQISWSSPRPASAALNLERKRFRPSELQVRVCAQPRLSSWPDLFGLVPVIHAFFLGKENVDARNKSAHDDNWD